MGPRPALPNGTATYANDQRKCLSVKPGMYTLLADVRNRDSIAFDEWVDLELGPLHIIV